MQTLMLMEEMKHITIFLNGCYLACETPTGVTHFWKTVGRTQHPDPQEQFRGTAPCWLAPEELIMVVDEGLAYI